MGRVGGAQGEVEEEGLVGEDRLVVAEEVLCAVDDVFGEVVALFGGFGGFDEVVVVDQVWVVLVGFAAEEAVEAVEASLEGPIVEGSGGGAGFGGVEVPFADGEGGVVLVAEDFGHGGGVA